MPCRKKKKATLEVEKEEKVEDGAGSSKPEQNDDEAAQKKKADDLWALFLSDVGPRPKDSAASQPCSTAQVGGACSQYSSGGRGLLATLQSSCSHQQPGPPVESREPLVE